MEYVIKALILDLDGTLVTRDMLDVLCVIAGKEKLSADINSRYQSGELKGLNPLIDRINLLKGLSIAQIYKVLGQNPCIMPGSLKLFCFLRDHKIITILNSGNILPVLSFYKDLFNIDYIIGSKPKIVDNKIDSISKEDYPKVDFKLYGAKSLLEHINIKAEDVIAIGDSISDRSVFEFAYRSIAINPTYGIEKYADFIVSDSLIGAIDILSEFIHK